MRAIMLTATSSILLTLAFVLLGRGSFFHWVAVGALVVVAAAAALAGILAFAVSNIGPSPRIRAAAWISLGLAAVLGSTLASLPLGNMILRSDVHAAKEYCESLVPRLEEHRRLHGTYPRDINAVGYTPDPPRLLRERMYYSSDGSSYSFDFTNPSGLLNGFRYDSDSRKWYDLD